MNDKSKKEEVVEIIQREIDEQLTVNILNLTPKGKKLREAMLYAIKELTKPTEPKSEGLDKLQEKYKEIIERTAEPLDGLQLIYMEESQVISIVEEAIDESYTLGTSKQELVELDDLTAAEFEDICALVHKAYCQYCVDIKGEEYWTKGDYNLLEYKVKLADRYTAKAVINYLKQKKGTKPTKEGNDD